MTRPRPSALLAALFVAGAVLPAQEPDQLIGLTANTPLLRTQALDTCQFTHRCTPPGLSGVTHPWDGGTAFDSTTGSAWVTDGNLLARVRPGDCVVDCGPYPLPTGTPTASATGLAISEAHNQLMVLDSSGFLTTLSLSASCQAPVQVSSCDTGLRRGPNASTSGLAIDERHDLVFYSFTDFGNRTSRLFIADRNNPCTPLFQGAIADCNGRPFGPVTGLAVDGCRQVLYATSGFAFVAIRYQPTSAGIQLGPVRCCAPLSIGQDPYVGLAILPGGGTPVGQPCANGSCRPCPMEHRLLTSPTVGNPNLVASLRRAQDNSLTWLFLGAGPCQNIGPIVRPLCGPVLVAHAVPPIAAGPFPVASAGGGPCTASAQVVISVPDDPSFCGTVWSTQFLSLCSIGPTGPGFGTAISNCVSFRIGGS